MWRSGWGRKKSGVLRLDVEAEAFLTEEHTRGVAMDGALGKGRPGVLQPQTAGPGGGSRWWRGTQPVRSLGRQAETRL